MADLDVQREARLPPEEEDYSVAELIYWIVGILMIPLVPIILSFLLTPWSGM